MFAKELEFYIPLPINVCEARLNTLKKGSMLFSSQTMRSKILSHRKFITEFCVHQSFLEPGCTVKIDGSLNKVDGHMT